MKLMTILQNMDKKIEKKSILSGEVETHENDEKYSESKSITTDKTEDIEFTHPLTGKKTSLTLNRATDDPEQLGAVLLSNRSKDTKDAYLANYLFAQGLESASFLAELFKSKGKHTKETRAFKSQMRFDYEVLINSLTLGLTDISNTLDTILGHKILENKDEIIELSKKMELHDAISRVVPVESKEECALSAMVLQLDSLSELLVNRVKEITEKRLEDSGYGIFVNTKGRVYSIFDEGVKEEFEKEYEEARKKNTKSKKKS